MYQSPDPVEKPRPAWLQRFYREPQGRPLNWVAAFLVLFGVVPFFVLIYVSASGPLLARIAFLLMGFVLPCYVLAEILPKRWISQAALLRAVGLGCTVLFIAIGVVLWLLKRFGLL
jgi:hypothetical protein